MEITSYLIWNVILSLVIAPIFYSIRQNAAENKRIDILINKTREEMARNYVTKDDLADLSSDELLEIVGDKIQDLEEANKIIMKAREDWFNEIN